MKKNRKLYKKLLVLVVGIYVIFTFINQQKTLNQYRENSKELASQIQEQKTYQEELIAKKDTVTSDEYIEETAREKLDMYLPNEKVYVDRGL